jgi:hypothetical protein
MTPGRKQLLLLLVLIPLLAGAFELRVKDNMADFSVFYRAGQRLRLGETLYRQSDGHYQFKYMPFSAFLYLPLTLVPLGAAKAAWYAVVIISTGLVFCLTIRLLRPGRRKAVLICVIAAIVLGRYFLREIELGQVNALITALLLLMILSFDSGPPGRGAPRWRVGRATGPGWGLAAALKPYALIFLPYFLLKKKWQTAAGGLAVLGLAVLAPAVFYGLEGNFIVLGEWRSSLSASTRGLLSTQDNVSFMGFLAKRTGNQDLQRLLYALVLAGLAGLVFALIRLGRKTPRPHVLECFLLLALIPIVSPLGWDYTMLSAAPAVMLVVSHLDKYPRPARVFLGLTFAAIAFSLYDVMGRALYARFMSWSMITVGFMILVGYISYLRFQGHA